MLHVFIGDDDYTLRQAVEEVRKSAGDPTAVMTNTTVLDGRQVSPAELRQACETVPFLSDKRLVIVEGLLERFDANARTGRKKSSKKDEGPEPWKLIAEGIKALPDFTELIIIGGDVKPANPLLKELMPTNRVRMMKKLRPAELKSWVNRQVTEKGSKISPAAVDILVQFVGSDLWVMASEIEKLSLYCGKREIDVKDVRELVSATQEANIFTMVDAILEGKVSTAQSLFHRLLGDGVAPTHLLIMISRQVRIIYQMKEMRKLNKPRKDIATALGLNFEFVLNKAWAQADKYSLERLKEIYHRLLDTDIAIKTGLYDGELALTILIAEMGPASSGRR